ncbi:MAG: hypothetical protein V1875_00875 [Candidatus Altiarchaeota archaeon]
MAKDWTMLKSRLALATYTILILALGLVLFPRSFNAGGGGFWMCLDYLRDGTLYGGQPFCAQSPTIYYAGYLVDSTLGSYFPELTLPAISLVAHIVIFISLASILKRHKLYDPLIYPLLYVLLVFRYFGEAASSLATAFFMVGFVLAYGSNDRNRVLMSTLPFTLAILTKYSVAMPVALVLVYSIIRDGIRRTSDGGVSISFEGSGWRVWHLILTAAAVVAAFAALSNFYPDLAAYTIYAHINQVQGGLISGLETMADQWLLSSFGAAILFAGVAWSVYRGFFDRETFVFPLLQVTLIANGLLLLMASGDPKLGEYYLLPVAPFLIAAMLAIRRRSRMAFAIIVVGALVHPAIFHTPLAQPLRTWSHDPAMDAVREVEFGLKIIPSQRGYILMEGPPGHKEYMRKLWPQLDESRIDMITEGGRGFSQGEGPDWAHQLRGLVNITANFSQAYGKLSPQEMTLRSDLVAGKYSLIVAGPPSWFSIMNVVNSAPEPMESYCTAYVPNFQYRGDGRVYTTLFFKDRQQCAMFKNLMIAYYQYNFEGICGLGRKAANSVRQVIAWGGAEVPFSCGAESDYAYSADTPNRAQWLDLLLFALILPLSHCIFELADWFRPTEHPPAKPERS